MILILAGGMGTRLQTISNGKPKCLVTIQGKCFIDYLLESIKIKKIEKICISLGYKSEEIIEYINQTEKNISNISFLVESEALGTGGAIKNFFIKHPQEREVIVINGDTLIQDNFEKFHKPLNYPNEKIRMGVVQVENVSRFGAVQFTTNKKLIHFNEKLENGEGYINAGVYRVSREVFEDIDKVTFSFEKEILEKKVNIGNITVEILDGLFIDIGVPEDYERLNAANLNTFMKS